MRPDRHTRQRDARLGNELFAHCGGTVAGGNEGVGGASSTFLICMTINPGGSSELQ